MRRVRRVIKSFDPVGRESWTNRIGLVLVCTGVDLASNTPVGIKFTCPHLPPVFLAMESPEDPGRKTASASWQLQGCESKEFVSGSAMAANSTAPEAWEWKPESP